MRSVPPVALRRPQPRQTNVRPAAAALAIAGHVPLIVTSVETGRDALPVLVVAGIALASLVIAERILDIVSRNGS